MKVQIPANAIRAAAYTMAQKDIWYYLNGVLLDFLSLESCNVVGADGNILFVGNVSIEYLEGEQTAPYQIIVPADAVKKLDKKAKSFILESLPDGRYTLGGQVFAAIDGVFPDYRRVIPKEVSGEWAVYNPDFVSKCVGAINAFYGNKVDNRMWNMKPNGNGPAVIFGPDNRAVAAVMPFSTTRKGMEDYQTYHGFGH